MSSPATPTLDHLPSILSIIPACLPACMSSAIMHSNDGSTFSHLRRLCITNDHVAFHTIQAKNNQLPNLRRYICERRRHAICREDLTDPDAPGPRWVKSPLIDGDR